MAKLKKYTFSGEASGELTVNKALLEGETSQQLIKDYIVAIRANARQWSASTKGRSDVDHSKKKPFKQKGTGNARQGSLASPQYRGGGIVFGPKPKFNQQVRVNRKEKLAAIRQLLAEKVAEKRIYIIKDFGELKKPQTKTVWAFLQSQKIGTRPVLFVGEGSYKDELAVPSDKHDAVRKSVNNIPRSGFVLAANVNGYDVSCAHSIVISEAAFKELTKRVVEA
ncbi:MAG: 50S ribosomal protein L4 [Chlamydiales bacterium]|nr:50S ribosomal protein L4 [Chlamydiales bacterium]MCH9619771.1 50S ribosomal protein L4 [Chlamydiales bacterium]MCH9623377.1 50S ribosomal protein L4 [Chlamydiales bacterium]